MTATPVAIIFVVHPSQQFFGLAERDAPEALSIEWRATELIGDNSYSGILNDIRAA